MTLHANSTAPFGVAPFGLADLPVLTHELPANTSLRVYPPPGHAYEGTTLGLFARLTTECGHANSGFNPPDLVANPLYFPTKIALVMSELGEAIDADRRAAMDDKLPQYLGRDVEIADALIRLLDLAYNLQTPLDEIYQAKMAFNSTRADHSATERAKVGGKRY